MHIKQLIQNEQEYWKFVWPFIKWAQDSRQSLWREEDQPKLEPFFNAQNRKKTNYQEWPQEVKDSFDFYLQCDKEYGKKNAEIRDSVSRTSVGDLFEAFGYYYDYEDDDDYVEDKPQLLELKIDFPFIVIGEISCGWDRAGDYKILMVDFVSLSDFTNLQKEV